MKIVNVIPLAKRIKKENLIYYSLQDIKEGTIVTVPLRKKFVDAIVCETQNVINAKIFIKNLDFSLRKIEKVKKDSCFPEKWWPIIENLKNYYVSSSGAILSNIIPQIFFKNYENIEIKINKNFLASNLKPEKNILQLSFKERLDFYKKLIREHFAREESILICVPTFNDINLIQQITQPFKERVLTFGNEKNKKNFLKKLDFLNKNHQSFLIISTPIFLFLSIFYPRIKTIIIEKEASPFYVNQKWPFVDMRILAELIAENFKKQIIFADSFLRIETIYRYQQKNLSEILPVSFRIKETTKEIISLKEEWQKSKNNLIVSERLKQTIEEIITKEEKIFIFCLRKGFYPLTLCGDCGNLILCKKCNSPLVLYKKEENIFLCHKCRLTQKVNFLCENCQSWNLKSLGFAIDLVFEEIKKIFPNLRIFKIDKETIKNKKEIEKVINDFKNTKPALLLGTEIALFYLNEEVDNSAIVSFDSLFFIPDFRINEKIVSLLIKTNELTKNKFLIQTKETENFILKSWLSNNLRSFVNEELEDRKKFNYPPFGTLFYLEIPLPQKNQTTKIKEYFDLFKEYQPKKNIKIKKGKKYLCIFIKLSKEKWNLENNIVVINYNLKEKILTLPQAAIWQII